MADSPAKSGLRVPVAHVPVNSDQCVLIPMDDLRSRRQFAVWTVLGARERLQLSENLGWQSVVLDLYPHADETGELYGAHLRVRGIARARQGLYALSVPPGRWPREARDEGLLPEEWDRAVAYLVTHPADADELLDLRRLSVLPRSVNRSQKDAPQADKDLRTYANALAAIQLREKYRTQPWTIPPNQVMKELAGPEGTQDFVRLKKSLGRGTKRWNEQWQLPYTANLVVKPCVRHARQDRIFRNCEMVAPDSVPSVAVTFPSSRSTRTRRRTSKPR